VATPSRSSDSRGPDQPRRPDRPNRPSLWRRLGRNLVNRVRGLGRPREAARSADVGEQAHTGEEQRSDAEYSDDDSLNRPGLWETPRDQAEDRDAEAEDRDAEAEDRDAEDRDFAFPQEAPPPAYGDHEGFGLVSVDPPAYGDYEGSAVAVGPGNEGLSDWLAALAVDPDIPAITRGWLELYDCRPRPPREAMVIADAAEGSAEQGSSGGRTRAERLAAAQSRVEQRLGEQQHHNGQSPGLEEPGRGGEGR
jgi:hypothetical protein